MSKRQEICLGIYYQEFRQGYEYGRCLYFHKEMRLTDEHLVEGLLDSANNPENHQNAKAMYHAMGFVFGQMSACVLPLQPGEEDAKAVKEAFLQEVKEKYEGSGEDLALLIRDYWDGHDLLAERLDASMFVQMLNRGKKQHIFMEEEGEE